MAKYQTGRQNAGSGHSYRLDGKPVKGVTTLIKGGLPAPNIAYWAPRMAAQCVWQEWDFICELQRRGERALVDYVKEAPWRDRDAAAKRGTEVHSYAEQLAAGESVIVPEELEGHVLAYRDFLTDWEPEVVALEQWCFSRRHHYGGTFDMIAWLPTSDDGELELWLLDIKTTRSGVFGETVLQLSGYQNAEFYLDERDGSEHEMPVVHRTGVIWVRADGYDLIPVHTDETTYRTFLHCAAVTKATAKVRNRDPLADRVGDPMEMDR